jgi:hypothetical protein
MDTAKIEAIRVELHKLDKKGELTPNAVVDAARDIESPMHSWFQWDDAEAAHSYRLDQARALIRRVTVVVTNEIHSIVPIFVRNPENDSGVQGYTATAALSGENSELAVAEALVQAVGNLRRAALIATSANLNLGISEMTAPIQALIDELRKNKAA